MSLGRKTPGPAATEGYSQGQSLSSDSDREEVATIVLTVNDQPVSNQAAHSSPLAVSISGPQYDHPLSPSPNALAATGQNNNRAEISSNSVPASTESLQSVLLGEPLLPAQLPKQKKDGNCKKWLKYCGFFSVPSAATGAGIGYLAYRSYLPALIGGAIGVGATPLLAALLLLLASLEKAQTQSNALNEERVANFNH